MFNGIRAKLKANPKIYLMVKEDRLSFYNLILKPIKMAYYLVKYGRELKLNVGAGPGTSVRGWLVADYSKTKWADFRGCRIDINENLGKGIPLSKDTVAAIYASHFLEHLNWFEGDIFIKECYRVLRPGGTIRLVVPNGEFFINKFLERDQAFFRNPKACFNHWLGNLTDSFLWNFFGAFASAKRNYACHAMFYNEENLIFRLSNAGFTQIERKSFNESSFECFADEYKFFPGRQVPIDVCGNCLIVEARRDTK